MVLQDQKDVASRLLHATIHSRTGHGLPSARRHSQIEEIHFWPYHLDPTEEDLSSKPGRGRCGLARDGYETGKCLLSGWRGDPKSRTLSPRNVRIVQRRSAKTTGHL